MFVSGLTIPAVTRQLGKAGTHCLAAILTLCFAGCTREISNGSQPPVLRMVSNLPYAGNSNPEQSLDLYLPVSSKRPAPLIVFIHGGGWAEGDKQDVPSRPLVACGYACASINYRLSKTAKFPAQIHDCKAAIRWLRAHAGQYNFDPDKIGVWGISSGGQLAALLGTSGGVQELEGKEGVMNTSSRVQAVCDWSGPTDLRKIVEQSAPMNMEVRGADGFIARFLGGLPSQKPELARLADPGTFVTSDDPPFLIMHGDRDTLIPIEQSRELYKELQAASVPSQLVVIPGAGHGDGFGSNENFQVTRKFFDANLKPEP